MIKPLAIGLFILLNLACLAQTEKTIDWEKDIKFLKKELPSKHYNLFFSMSKKEFNARLDDILNHRSGLTDLDIAIKLVQVVAKVGDSHTAVEFWRLVDNRQKLPLQLYWFSDGLYVIQTVKQYKDLLGTKINKINGFKIETVIDSLSTLITLDNQAMVKSKVPRLISFVQLLRYFKFATNDSIRLDVESSTGETASYQISSGRMLRNNMVSVKPDTVPLCMQNQDAYFYEQYLKNEKVYYVQYNKCWSKELENSHDNKAKDLPSFNDFQNKIFNTIIGKNKPIEKFIFDMRYNEGGNSTQGTDFITKLAGFTAVNQKNKLFVIIGRATFSSAIINTIDFKQKTNAILVGEETAGKPNHYGETRFFRLPSSQMVVNYSTKYFQFVKRELKTITPDIMIEPSFSDYKKGIDPVYEWIANQK
ncbi:MAG TPA: S41 family peptidase [Bacteroidales bacterium]